MDQLGHQSRKEKMNARHEYVKFEAENDQERQRQLESQIQYDFKNSFEFLQMQSTKTAVEE